MMKSWWIPSTTSVVTTSPGCGGSCFPRVLQPIKRGLGPGGFPDGRREGVRIRGRSAEPVVQGEAVEGSGDGGLLPGEEPGGDVAGDEGVHPSDLLICAPDLLDDHGRRAWLRQLEPRPLEPGAQAKALPDQADGGMGPGGLREGGGIVPVSEAFQGEGDGGGDLDVLVEDAAGLPAERVGVDVVVAFPYLQGVRPLADPYGHLRETGVHVLVPGAHKRTWAGARTHASRNAGRTWPLAITHRLKGLYEVKKAHSSVKPARAKFRVPKDPHTHTHTRGAWRPETHSRCERAAGDTRTGPSDGRVTVMVCVCKPQGVLESRELVQRIGRALDGGGKARLRLANRFMAGAVLGCVESLKVEASCVRPPDRAMLRRLGNFEGLTHVHVLLADVPLVETEGVYAEETRFMEIMLSMAQGVRGRLRKVTLEATPHFPTTLYSTATFMIGSTWRHVHLISPFFRRLPCARNVPSLRLTTRDVGPYHFGPNLTAVTLTTCELEDPDMPVAHRAASVLIAFRRTATPSLLSLDISFVARTCMDLSFDTGLDLGQLRSLALRNVDLFRDRTTRTLFLAAPGLHSLTLATVSNLAVPGNGHEAKWPSLLTLSLSLTGGDRYRNFPRDRLYAMLTADDYVFPGTPLPYIHPRAGLHPCTR